MKLLKKRKISSVIVVLCICIQLLSVNTVVLGANDYSGELRYDFIDGIEGFYRHKDGNGDGSISNTDDCLVLNYTRSSSGDSNIGFARDNVTIDTAVHKYLNFRIKLPEDGTEIRVYLLNGKSADGSTSVGKSRWMDNINQSKIAEDAGEWAVYSLDFSGADNSGDYNSTVVGGTYTLQIRVYSPRDNGAREAYLDWVAFSQNQPYDISNGEPSIIEAIALEDAQELNISTCDGICECSIYQSTYDSFLENLDSLQIEYNGDYSDTSMSYRIIDGTNYKLLDITATGIKEDIEYSRSYRIKITPKPDPEPTIVISKCVYSNEILDFSGYVMNAKGDDYVRDEIVLVMAYNQDSGLGDSGQNLKVWKTLRTDENGEFADSIRIRDDETVSQLYTMQIVFCSSGSVGYETVTYYNDKCIETLVADMATKNDGIFAYMTAGVNKPAFESLGVAFQKYESYSSSEQININDNTKNNQSKVSAENVVELANGTLLAFSSKKATNDTTLISTLDEFDENVMKIKLKGDTVSSFSKLDSSRKKTIVSHFQSNLISTDYDDWFEFKNGILESMLLEYISTQRSSAAVKKVILDNKDIILHGKTSGDSYILQSLELETSVAPDDAITYLLTEQKGTIFPDAEALLNAIEKALEETADSNGGTGGSTGGSSGGTGGGTGSKNDSFVVVDNNETNNNDKEIIENISTKSVYSDLENYEWAETAIKYLTELEIVRGIGGGLFEPARPVTREEFTKLLCEAFELKDTDEDADFADIPQDAWYRNYVACAVSNGVVKGISNDMFGSGKHITREDMAVLIYRALKVVNKEINSENVKFTDYDETADYAQEAVGMLAGVGIVNGVGNGSFAPKAVASRAEASVIIYRCIELLEK